MNKPFFTVLLYALACTTSFGQQLSLAEAVILARQRNLEIKAHFLWKQTHN